MCAVPANNWSCSMPRDAPSISMVNVAVVCGVECHVFEAHGVRATVAVLPDSRSSHCITAAITEGIGRKCCRMDRERNIGLAILHRPFRAHSTEVGPV